MKRFRKLVTEVRKRFAEDSFFANFEKLLEDPEKRKHYRAYNDALHFLDEDSWTVLKAKAIREFRNEREGQLKQGFFNQLNEAFAYRYLVRKGFKNVRVLVEGKEKRPDLSYLNQGAVCHCEVKTLGITDNEIRRRGSGKVFDLGVYRDLSDVFEEKLLAAIRTAWKQLHAAGPNGIVFIIVNPDDIAQDHYHRHRKQIAKLHARHGFNGVVVKFGHTHNRTMTFR